MKELSRLEGLVGFSQSSTASSCLTRRKEVQARFKPFWNALNSNNRNYIAAQKTPNANTQVWSKYNNALKTAKARAEWLKAKKFNFTKEELKGLRNYVKGKNENNRNRREAKRVKA